MVVVNFLLHLQSRRREVSLSFVVCFLMLCSAAAASNAVVACLAAIARDRCCGQLSQAGALFAIQLDMCAHCIALSPFFCAQTDNRHPFYFLPPPPPHLHVLLLIVAISRYFANDKVLTDALYGLTDIRGLENAEQQGEIEGLAKASGLPLKFVQGIQML